MTPAPESFKTEVLDSPQGARIIRLTGPLTIRTLFDFQNAARREITRPVIVDINGVAYMDSAGLGCVVSVFTSCQRRNCGFGVIGLTGRIRTLLQVTHLDGILPTFATLEAAEQAVLRPGN